VGIFIFGIIAFYFVIRLFFTLLFVVAPALVLASVAANSFGRDDFPDPDEFIDPALENLISQIDQVLAVLSEAVANYYEVGDSNGIQLTAKSNQTRFDARKALGRELNAALDDAASKIAEHQSLRLEYSKRRQALKEGYYGQVKKWARPKSASAANWVAAVVFVLTIFSALTTGIGDLAASVVVANPYNARPGLIAGFIAGALAYGITFFTLMRMKIAHSNYSARHEERAAFLAKLNLAERSDAAGQINEEGAAESDVKDVQAERTDDWHVVLNVGADAPVDQIKSAYRDAIKQYHPDNFEGRGRKIKDLANQETRRINAAYEAAREDRQF
jgi:hypothetical protein